MNSRLICMLPRTPFPLKLFAKKIAGKKTSRLGVFYVCATDGSWI